MRKKTIIFGLILFGFLYCIRIHFLLAAIYILCTLIPYLFICIYYKAAERNDVFLLSVLNSLMFPILGYLMAPILGKPLTERINQLIHKINAMGLLKLEELNQDQSIFLVSIILLLGSAFLYHFQLKDHTGMKKHQSDLWKDIPDKNYRNRRSGFCRQIANRMESINCEMNWSDDFFTPLNADIEVFEKNKIRKKTVDLLQALKGCSGLKNKNIYLVIGEPGSGKSVTLRKLCGDLIHEVEKTGKVPVYINLKEWNVKWDKDRIPRERDIERFILGSLKKEGSVTTGKFLDDYFVRMLETGRWFFILDSFDEIPCLIGAEEGGFLNDKLSKAIYDFLADSNCGGILASRPFHSPTNAFRSHVCLRIQPYSEKKVKVFLKNYLPELSEGKIRNIFLKNYDVIQAAKNPFYASLLCSYISNHKNSLPETQSQCFNDFIHRRLEECASYMEELHLDKAKVIKAAKGIAAFMFQSASLSLEAPVKQLLQNCGESGVCKETMEALVYAKICRVDSINETITFVHRRFQEYFLVKEFQDSHQMFPEQVYQNIVNHTKWRDALVLHCEIAEEEEAKKIAGYCWEKMKENGINYTNIFNVSCRKAIYCINFLSEAFRRRLDILSSFQEEMSALILECMEEEPEPDLVCMCQFARAIYLYQESYIERILYKLVNVGYNWLNEEIISQICYFERISLSLKICFCHYIDHIPIHNFFFAFRENLFNFSISKAFRLVRGYCWLRLFDFLFAAAELGIILYLASPLKEYGLFTVACSTDNSGYFFSCIMMVLAAFLYCDILNGWNLETLLRGSNWLFITLFFAYYPIEFFPDKMVLFILTVVPLRKLILLGVKAANRLWSQEKFHFRKSWLQYLLFVLLIRYLAGRFFVSNIYYKILLTGFTAVFTCYLLWMGGRFLNSLFYYRKFTIIKQKDRRQLEGELACLKNPWVRTWYLKRLIRDNVELSGEWEENKRPAFEDDESTLLLISLDIGKEDLNMHY